MSTGRFSGLGRTGASIGSVREALLNSLNSSRGSAYNTEPGTVVYAENYAIAKTLEDAWNTAQRLANQFDPARMTAYISRWEKILGIIPKTSQTLNDRRNIITAKFSIINKVPTHQILKDYLIELIPDLFLDILTTSSDKAAGSVPGGITVPGGVTLPAGDWQSSIAHLAIRVYEPIALESSVESFYNQVGNFIDLFDKFLSAHITFEWGRYTFVHDGYISMAAGSKTVIGSGTLFITDASDPILVGDEIEVYDDDGTIRTLVVVSVDSETSLTVLESIDIAITLKKYKTKGFILDQENNIDNALFD